MHAMTECPLCWNTGFVKGHGAFCPKGCKAPGAAATAPAAKQPKSYKKAPTGKYEAPLRDTYTKPLSNPNFGVRRDSASQYHLVSVGNNDKTYSMTHNSADVLVHTYRFQRIDGSGERMLYIPRTVSIDELLPYFRLRIDACFSTTCSFPEPMRKEAAAIVAEVSAEYVWGRMGIA
jgi:hypothetical protein